MGRAGEKVHVRKRSLHKQSATGRETDRSPGAKHPGNTTPKGGWDGDVQPRHNLHSVL